MAQPLSTSEDGHSPEVVPVRHKLPRKRHAVTHSFKIADTKGYITVGEYDDGRPGEIFIKVAKQGSTLAAIMDAFAIAVSHGLQYGVPLSDFVAAYSNMVFEPRGFTDDPEIRTAQSLMDYIFRRLNLEYGDALPVAAVPVSSTEPTTRIGELCGSCGTMMLRAGTCWACPGCGSTTGCG